MILAEQPIEFFTCFISYTSHDEEAAKKIYAELDSKGIRSWFAHEDLKIGERFRGVIANEIRRRDKLLVILSRQSIRSAWVRREVKLALEEEERTKKTVLFPIRLDEAVMDTTEQWADEIRRSRHIGDFTNWQDEGAFKQAFDGLIQDLEKGSSGGVDV